MQITESRVLKLVYLEVWSYLFPYLVDNGFAIFGVCLPTSGVDVTFRTKLLRQIIRLITHEKWIGLSMTSCALGHGHSFTLSRYHRSRSFSSKIF